MVFGPGDNVVNGEKIGGVIKLTDKGQLFPDGRRYLVWNTAGIPPGGPLPGQLFDMLLRRRSGRHRFVRILVSKLIQRKWTAIGNLLCPAKSRLEPLEKPRHFLGRLEVSFGIGFQPEASLINGAVLADTGHHIL